MEETPAYGLWSLVIINSLVFIIFAFSFSKPRTKRDWRSFSAFSAFIVALFVEMYGFPLTIYLLSGWLVQKYPGVDFLSHDAGHLLNTLIGWKIDPHFDPLHILSNVLIFGGFILLRIYSFVGRMESALRSSEDAHAGDDGPVCLRASSTIRRVHSHHVGFSIAVADADHVDHVSRFGVHVRSAGATRRKRGAG